LTETATTTDTTTAPASQSFTCARRQILLGAGIGGVALVAAGCGGSSKSDASSDASTAPSSAAAGGSSSAATTSPPAAKGLIALTDVPTDAAVAVDVPESVSKVKSVLITQSGGKVVALDATCTHMACKVAPDGGQLHCPCHQSTYELTGQVISGPAPAALAAVAVKVESGQVVLG
jgi:cytochrome b6-f complex iron-sulfur subunit